jgi:hypothetical protein
MTNVPSSGIEPGQRRLNGPQTTGREYHNLSQPIHAMAHDDDVAVPMRDGVTLLAAPSVSLTGKNVETCTTSSSGLRSNPGRTAMSA